MATHSSVLAWRIPGMGVPGGLRSIGSHRVGHNWSDLAAAAAAAYKIDNKDLLYSTGNSILSRDITLITKVCIVKAMVFPVVVYGCESWTIKSWASKNWCFWTMVLEETLRVPWTARRSNQSILKEISPEYSLEGLMLKLKLQYFGHLMWRTDSFEKT